jgi:molecular chaperone GrpE
MSEHVDQQIPASEAAPRSSWEDQAESTLDDPAVSQDGAAAEAEPVDEAQAVKNELDNAQRKAAENQEKYLRARADMENYKKRVERTYADLAKTSKKDLLVKLLSVKDNLERALNYGETANGAGGEGIMEGVRLTQYQLDQLLSSEGVKPIEVEGQPFDPRLEEAIQTIKDESVPDHTVAQVVRTGYTYGDEVLRPAQVIVSVHPERN